MSLLRNLHEAGRTIVLITHDADIAQAALRRVTLHDGAIELDNRREHAH